MKICVIEVVSALQIIHFTGGILPLHVPHNARCPHGTNAYCFLFVIQTTQRFSSGMTFPLGLFVPTLSKRLELAMLLSTSVIEVVIAFILEYLSTQVAWYSEKEAATEFLKTSQSQWIVITSGSNGDQFLSGIHNLPAVGPVIVFCEHPEYHATWVDKYSKIKAITTSITEVLNNIASSSLLDSVGTNNPSGNVIPDENLCVVCMTNKKQYAFVPCGHLALCGTCKGNIPPVKCMICRADTTSITQIFMWRCYVHYN